MTLGEGFTDLPLADMRVIDMSLGRDGVCQRLQQQVLAIERPELESRKHALNKDVLQLRLELKHQQVHCLIVHLFQLI